MVRWSGTGSGKDVQRGTGLGRSRSEMRGSRSTTLEAQLCRAEGSAMVVCESQLERLGFVASQRSSKATQLKVGRGLLARWFTEVGVRRPRGGERQRQVGWCDTRGAAQLC